MPVHVKICGLSDREGVDAAVSAGADLFGLVLFPPSPRNVSLRAAAALAGRAGGKAKVVALTVDADDALLAAIAGDLRPDFVQLHGCETPERTAEVRDRFALRVIKAVGVRERADLARAADYIGAADCLILDAKPPAGATRPGGHGVAFDWPLLEGFDPGMPWMLSGGLDPANVAEALARTNAPGVDVSSGVESTPGQKVSALIHAFVAAARGSAQAHAA